nr:immunoglobulin heavy chain junction region [Mus musculus]MBK4195761.1 immunoglobulin heavy chain junction region [Mus musculus]
CARSRGGSPLDYW